MRTIRGFVLLPGLWAPHALNAKPSAPNMGLINFCNEHNQPIFIYQHLWTDNPDPTKRKQEFWVDRDKDVLRVFWWAKDAKPNFLAGTQISETDFFLCAYRLGGKKPYAAFAGKLHANGIQIQTDPGSKTFDFVYTPVLNEARSYSLRYESRSVQHQIIGKIPSDRPFTCDTTVSSFQLVSSQPTKGLDEANRKISGLVQDIRWDAETPDCLNPKIPPSLKALGANMMFGSDRFLSAKMDFSEVRGLTGALQGRSLNLDLAQQKELDWNSILLPADQNILLKELNRRVRLAYGKDAKVETLGDCSFAFTSQTLVVSTRPQGIFEDRVDIPIPLDHLFKVLKIKPYGPFAN